MNKILFFAVSILFLFSKVVFAQPLAKDTEALQKQAANLGYQQSMGIDAKQLWDDEKKLYKQLMDLKPQNTKENDVFLIVAALDSDAVFSREAIETSKVLSKKYQAQGRTIVLATSDDEKNNTPNGNPNNLVKSIVHISEIMDKQNDILVLYLTTHGHPITGLAYKNKNLASGFIGPKYLANILSQNGIKRKMIIISACFSGIFIPELESEESVIVTAAAQDRTSFGCKPDNDWTFFGDAFINQAIRSGAEFKLAFQNARNIINSWERKARLKPSNPQIKIGEKADWLNEFDKNQIDLGKPNGKNSFESEVLKTTDN